MDDYIIFGDIVILEDIKDESDSKTESGIIVSMAEDEIPPYIGKVIATGEDCKNIKDGDIVLFHNYSAQFLKAFGKEYLLIKEDKIIGKRA
jgi:chaperonin GroES